MIKNICEEEGIGFGTCVQINVEFRVYFAL